MKGNLRKTMGALLLAGMMVLLAAWSGALAEESLLTAHVDVEYCYGETESMLKIINEFRTGDTWYWNSDDTTKTEVTGREALIYDYGLERAAMARAAEIAVYFEHQRPNGEMCFSVDSSLQIMGENIAAGQRSKEAAFTSWREENEDYANQGHRRNMLSENFSYIGIGCVKSNGVYYWVQEFGVYPSGEARSSLRSPAVFPLSEKVVELTDVTAASESMKINEGESAALPAVNAKAGWAEAPLTLTGVVWTPGKAEVLSTAEGKATALKGGRTNISASLGSGVTVKVTCVCKEHTMDAGVVTTAPTCTATGILTRTCTVCGETADEVLPVVPHTLEKTEKKDSTCTETGTEAFWTCSVCEKLFSDSEGETEISAPAVIALKPHTLEKTEKKDSTCTETGTEAYWTCSVCGKLFSDGEGETEISAPAVIALKPHTPEKTEKKEPTCTEAGTEAYWTCSVCGKLFSDSGAETEISAPKEIEALGHDWDEGEITKEPTYSEEGIRTHTCRRCGETKEETVSISIPVGKSGWVQNADGSWSYGDERQNALVGMQNVGGVLYCFDEEGKMATGWILAEDKWYYAAASGALARGWLAVNGTWYYFRADGEMAVGWVQDGGAWYFMKDSGAMATGWVENKGDWYFMDNSGAMKTGWMKSGKDWYLLKSSGKMATGWQNVSGTWYYFSASGAMADEWQRINGEWYYFRNGAMVTGWFEDKEAEKRLPRNQKKKLWYWFDENGVMARGWKTVNGQWEMFDEQSGLWLYTWDGK